MPASYASKIRGHLDRSWSDWLAGLRLTHSAGDETLLSGPLPAQGDPKQWILVANSEGR